MRFNVNIEFETDPAKLTPIMEGERVVGFRNRIGEVLNLVPSIGIKWVDGKSSVFAAPVEELTAMGFRNVAPTTSNTVTLKSVA